MKYYLLNFIFGTLLCACAFSCKKEKKYVISGRLLFSNTLRTPVTNYTLHFYQGGSMGGAPIGIGTFSSQANALTDGAGNFSLVLKDGGGTILGVPVSNNNTDIIVSNDEEFTLPRIYLSNFPILTFTNSNVVYLCKKVDTVILTINCLVNVVPVDSFEVNAINLSGRIRKTKTGFTAAANTRVNIDTITNGIFSNFNFRNRKYFPDFFIKSVRRASFIQSDIDSLAEGDQGKVILNYTYR